MKKKFKVPEVEVFWLDNMSIDTITASGETKEPTSETSQVDASYGNTLKIENYTQSSFQETVTLD